ncbi:MAG TPA: reverse transcriptase domain-containing protein [Xanthobacteraceae bacterium]
MPRRHDQLFDRIASFQALHAAARRAINGKRKKPGAAAFFANLEGELLALERQLHAVTYRPGRYVAFAVNDPKKRIVSAAPFRDRVVHHALCAVVDPIFEKGFVDHTFANRVAKGTHKAIDAYERYRNRHAYVLRCDIYRYFPSIDHAILKSDFRRRIECPSTLGLMDMIVDRSNRQEPVQLYFDGDDLFEPFRRRRGLPIGNLTSQFFANLYLDGLDHFVTEVLRAPYVRYVDDFAVFADDHATLLGWRSRIERYLAGRRLKLHPRKTFISPCPQPAEFLGFLLCQHRHRRLPEDNIRRFRNRLRGLRDQWRAGTTDIENIDARVRAWIAHADTWRLRHAIFRGGRFDPANARQAWTAPCRCILRGRSWNNTPDNLRSANRNRNTTDTRNNNIGFRVGRTLCARAGAITVAPGVL